MSNITSAAQCTDHELANLNWYVGYDVLLVGETWGDVCDSDRVTELRQYPYFTHDDVVTATA